MEVLFEHKGLDILTWDPYNTLVCKGKTCIGNSFLSVEDMFGIYASHSASVSNATYPNGLPWAIAEFGTPLEPRDQIALCPNYIDNKIACWLKSLAVFARDPGGEGSDYRPGLLPGQVCVLLGRCAEGAPSVSRCTSRHEREPV
jgi:hypothetical protein